MQHIKHKRAESAFIRRWTLATGAGLTIGMALVLVSYLGVFDRGSYGVYLFGLIVRAMLQVLPMAVLQALLFRRLELHIPLRTWAMATMIGMGLVVMLQLLVKLWTVQPFGVIWRNISVEDWLMMNDFMQGTWLTSRANHVIDVSHLLGRSGTRFVPPYLPLLRETIVMALIYGAAIGLAQFLVLRRCVRGAWRWIIHSVGAYGVFVGVASSIVVRLTDYPWLWRLFSNSNTYDAGWIFVRDVGNAGIVVVLQLIIGLAVGWIMANLLVRLRRDGIPDDWTPKKHNIDLADPAGL